MWTMLVVRWTVRPESGNGSVVEMFRMKKGPARRGRKDFFVIPLSRPCLFVSKFDFEKNYSSPND